MTIAISGCGGFIGNVLVRHLLDNGYPVRGMDNFDKGHCDALLGVIDRSNFEFFEGDVCNPKDCEHLVKDCSGVVNLAALVGFPRCLKRPELAHLVNVNGVANMVAARNNFTNLAPFIQTSTGSVYGAVIDDICTEETPCNTNTVYGITKLKAEEILRKERNVIIYRYATAFGVSPSMRVNLLVNDFVNRALTDRSLTIFEADFKRTFIHILDFARTIGFALKNYDKMTDVIYNAGDEKLNWSKRDVAEYIKGKTGCHITYADIGKDLDVRNYTVSYKRLNKLGFYCHINMEKGIDELIKAGRLLRSRNPYD